MNDNWKSTRYCAHCDKPFMPKKKVHLCCCHNCSARWVDHSKKAKGELTAAEKFHHRCKTHGLCPYCGKVKAKEFVTCYKCRKKNRACLCRQRSRARNEVIQRYGGKCVCCGEAHAALLAIDHKKGGGNRHRQKMVSQLRLYNSIIAAGFPTDYELLCHNCNVRKDRPLKPDAEVVQSIRSRRRLRREVLLYYSHGELKCACCGIDEYDILQLNHLNQAQRKTDYARFPKGGNELLTSLRRNRYPAGYSVLCASCNMGSAICGGRCPCHDPITASLLKRNDDPTGLTTHRQRWSP